jgi:hypothetical protein
MLAAERLPGAAYGAAFDTTNIRRLATAWMSHLDHDTAITGISVSRVQAAASGSISCSLDLAAYGVDSDTLSAGAQELQV